MPELKDRRARTRAEIVEVAVALFLERGFDETPMEDIAEAAGLSRRTLYRYFETKDDIVFESPRIWLRLLNSTLATRTDEESTRDVFHRALLDVAEYVQSQRERIVREFTVLTASPTLLARHGRSDAEWVARYVELLAPDVADEPDGLLLATIAAMTLVAAQNAVIAVWATDPDARDVTELVRVALDRVDSVWPPTSR